MEKRKLHTHHVYTKATSGAQLRAAGGDDILYIYIYLPTRLSLETSTFARPRRKRRRKKSGRAELPLVTPQPQQHPPAREAGETKKRKRHPYIGERIDARTRAACMTGKQRRPIICGNLGAAARDPRRARA